MPREQWASRYGFILASIGGAVGIDNWRFSYIAGENGGAVFLFIYLACLLIGIPLIIAELAVGRHAQGDAITAFETARKPERWNLVGWLGVIAATLLLSYYAVIAGWALKYFAGAATGALWRAARSDYGGYFRRFIADPGSTSRFANSHESDCRQRETSRSRFDASQCGRNRLPPALRWK